ncbi:hypothetical protein HDU84_006602 [Entophlyctis sp. JEL0112]|nr:hypothetical protein HDU84_006602 [Entophlyctis sp. JEL0112]
MTRYSTNTRHPMPRKLSFSTQPLLPVSGTPTSSPVLAWPHTRFFLLLAVAILIGIELSTLAFSRLFTAHPSSLTPSGNALSQLAPLCDPYKVPGMLHPDTLHWVTMPSVESANCSSADNFGLLADVQLGQRIPSHLANKIVLLLGDSFERNLVVELCERSGGQTHFAMLNGSFILDPIFGDSRICTIRDDFGDVFVAINIFHFGLPLGDVWALLAKGMHWREGYSPVRVSKRIEWLPHFLRSVAGLAFPEICAMHGRECAPPVWALTMEEKPDIQLSTPPLLDPADPFWFPPPDMIIANSMTWDLAKSEFIYVAQKYTPGNFPLESFKAFAVEWAELFKTEIIETLQATFGHAVKNVVRTDGVVVPRYFTRTLTIPVLAANRFAWPSFSMIDTLNNIMRLGGLRNPKNALPELLPGVLDWARLVAGMTIHSEFDDEHPNGTGNLAYWQLVLSRFEVLSRAT